MEKANEGIGEGITEYFVRNAKHLAFLDPLKFLSAGTPTDTRLLSLPCPGMFYHDTCMIYELTSADNGGRGADDTSTSEEQQGHQVELMDQRFDSDEAGESIGRIRTQQSAINNPADEIFEDSRADTNFDGPVDGCVRGYPGIANDEMDEEMNISTAEDSASPRSHHVCQSE